MQSESSKQKVIYGERRNHFSTTKPSRVSGLVNSGIYKVSSEIIEVIAIGPRKNIYEETLRLLKKEKGR